MFKPKILLLGFWYLKILDSEIYFGLRVCQEYMTLKVEDFVFCEDQNGEEHLEFREDPTKTRKYGLRSKEKITNP